jgi:hypothetical protein
MLPGLLLLAAVIGPDTIPHGARQVYDGRSGVITVATPKVDTSDVIDGNLDEPAWSHAAMLTGFSQFLPTDGVAAEDSTEVLVWYSSSAIYFGIRAFEPHGAPHATLAERDRIFADDYVQVLISTFNDGRQAMMFGVNPFGVQADGMMDENGRSGNNLQGIEPANLNQDFVYESKGHVTPWGYQVEIGIPFKSLKYQSAAEQVWGLQLLRTVQHSGFEDTWTPAKRASASFLAQSGELTGLSGLNRGLTLDVTPEVTSREVGATTDAGGWGYLRDGPNVGGTVRWGMTNNLVLDATVNPDFSQVESDASQVSFDPREQIYIPEKRPFFLEGFEQFNTPNQLIYTRRLVLPVAATKLTGKVAGTNLGMLLGVDGTSGSAYADRPYYGFLRLQRDVGGQSRLGMVYTGRTDGPDYNHVAAADGRVVFGKIYSAGFQFGGSVTRQGGTYLSGPVWQGRFSRNGRTVGLNYSINGLSPEFIAASGFIQRPGVVQAVFNNRVSKYGTQGAFLERLTGSVILDGLWNYRDFTEGRGVLEEKLHLQGSVALRGGWNAGGGIFLETYHYDPSLLTGAAIEVPAPGGGLDTIPFQPVPSIDNVDYFFEGSTPEFNHFSASVFTMLGRDVNFYEWQPANIFYFEGDLQLRPTDQLRVDFAYVQNQYNRTSDGSIVARDRIPRLKVEYQVARPLFFRVVGEYVASQVDSLRDDAHGGAPILLPGAGGTLVRAPAAISNGFRVDVLVSFRPTPGTTFFAGYGRQMDDPQAFGFSGMTRQADAFFLKASYLFRFGG